MDNKYVADKLREKAGTESLGLITALESLKEAELLVNDIEQKIKKLPATLEIIRTDIQTAKIRVMGHISMLISDDIK